MDDKRLDEIEARANAATPGPWKYDERHCFEDEVRICGCAVHFPYPGDAKFCAHSRTDIPDLIAAVRERDKEIERIRHELCVREDEISQLRFALQRIRSAFPYGESQWFHDVAQEALM